MIRKAYRKLAPLKQEIYSEVIDIISDNNFFNEDFSFSGTKGFNSYKKLHSKILASEGLKKFSKAYFQKLVSEVYNEEVKEIFQNSFETVRSRYTHYESKKFNKEKYERDLNDFYVRFSNELNKITALLSLGIKIELKTNLPSDEEDISDSNSNDFTLKVDINEININNKISQEFKTSFENYLQSMEANYHYPNLKSGHIPVPLYWKNFVYKYLKSKKLNISGQIINSPYLNNYKGAITYSISEISYRDKKIDTEIHVSSLFYIIRKRLLQKAYQAFDDYIIIELGNGYGAQLFFKRKNSSLNLEVFNDFEILTFHKKENENIEGVQIETDSISFIIKYFKNSFFHSTILPTSINDSGKGGILEWEEDGNNWNDDDYFFPDDVTGIDNNDNNRANQLNPNNPAYHSSRGNKKP